MTENLTFQQASFISRRYLPTKVAFLRLYLYHQVKPEIDSSGLFLFSMTQTNIFNNLTWVLRELEAPSANKWFIKQIPLNSEITQEIKEIIEDRVLEISSLINMYPIERAVLQQYNKENVIFLTEMLLNIIAEQIDRQ
jgi:hypothetical protein